MFAESRAGGGLAPVLARPVPSRSRLLSPPAGRQDQVCTSPSSSLPLWPVLPPGPLRLRRPERTNPNLPPSPSPKAQWTGLDGGLCARTRVAHFQTRQGRDAPAGSRNTQPAELLENGDGRQKCCLPPPLLMGHSSPQPPSLTSPIAFPRAPTSSPGASPHQDLLSVCRALPPVSSCPLLLLSEVWSLASILSCRGQQRALLCWLIPVPWSTWAWAQHSLALWPLLSSRDGSVPCSWRGLRTVSPRCPGEAAHGVLPRQLQAAGVSASLSAGSWEGPLLRAPGSTLHPALA